MVHTFFGIAEPKMAVPTFRFAGLHVADNAMVATVVVGIVAGLSIHGTLTIDAEPVVAATDTFDNGDGERAVDEPHADKATADIRKARDLAVRFLLIFVEV